MNKGHAVSSSGDLNVFSVWDPQAAHSGFPPHQLHHSLAQGRFLSRPRRQKRGATSHVELPRRELPAAQSSAAQVPDWGGGRETQEGGEMGIYVYV